MTQAQLARALGVQQNVVARLEDGGRPDPRLSTIVAVCEALGITMDALAAEAGLTQRLGPADDLRARHYDVVRAARAAREQLAELDTALKSLTEAAPSRKAPRRQ